MSERTDDILNRLTETYTVSSESFDELRKEIERLGNILITTKLHHESVTAKNAQEIERLEGVLKKIANSDYRGNRSSEQEMAYRALQESRQ